MRVFTYGTLRPSLNPSAVRRFGLTLVGPAELLSNMELVHLGWFPALVTTDASHTVVGELVEVNDLSKLDQYEGYRPDGRGLYNRREVLVSHNGEPTSAWVYYMTSRPPNAKPIVSGDWSKLGPDADPSEKTFT